MTMFSLGVPDRLYKLTHTVHLQIFQDRAPIGYTYYGIARHDSAGSSSLLVIHNHTLPSVCQLSAHIVRLPGAMGLKPANLPLLAVLLHQPPLPHKF
jgi:hypothetical protein